MRFKIFVNKLHIPFPLFVVGCFWVCVLAFIQLMCKIDIVRSVEGSKFCRHNYWYFEHALNQINGNEAEQNTCTVEVMRRSNALDIVQKLCRNISEVRFFAERLKKRENAKRR